MRAASIEGRHVPRLDQRWVDTTPARPAKACRGRGTPPSDGLQPMGYAGNIQEHLFRPFPWADSHLAMTPPGFVAKSPAGGTRDPVYLTGFYLMLRKMEAF